MVITELLERNAEQYPNDVALVEVNPPNGEEHHITWRDYSLIEGSNKDAFRSGNHMEGVRQKGEPLCESAFKQRY